MIDWLIDVLCLIQEFYIHTEKSRVIALKILNSCTARPEGNRFLSGHRHWLIYLNSTRIITSNMYISIECHSWQNSCYHLFTNKIVTKWTRPLPYRTQLFKQSSMVCDCKKVLFSNTVGIPVSSLLYRGIWYKLQFNKRWHCSCKLVFRILKSLHLSSIIFGWETNAITMPFKKVQMILINNNIIALYMWYIYKSERVC